MCGISALFTSSATFQAFLIKQMSTAIKHRGPDDEGYCLQAALGATVSAYGGPDTPPNVLIAAWPYCPKKELVDGNTTGCVAALGHRRLAILDLSPAGHQPMSPRGGDLWISYNGEIYNYLEIRQELIALGYHFTTDSDTEVILQAYQAWGTDCLNHFNGMFAFVIYDTRHAKIFAARDRFGVKPLYYWRSPRGLLAFASEIKQFTVLPGWSPRLNAQRGYDFLNWGLIDHTAETLFQGVQQLRGGECLLIPLQQASKGPLQPVRWYQLRPKPFQGTFQQAACAFKDLLKDAVRLRLRADVPVGSCLSGGLDSSSIVCLVHSLLGEKGQQKTFSACSHHKRFDEREYIEHIIKQTGVEAHYTYPDVDHLLEKTADILWHQDEPYPTTSIYAQWQVFKSAKKQGVKVILDGQGADEQLGGYQGFFGNRVYDLFSQLKWGEMLQEIRCLKHKYPHLQPWSQLLDKLVPEPLRQPLRRMLGKSSAGPHWLDLSLLQAKDRHPCRGDKNSTVRDQSYQQLMHTSLPMLLHFEDRDSMAHSIESRTPFLDYRLVEFNLGLPSEYKVSKGWTKHVMREGLKDVLPPSICWRTDKMGFLTAEEEWVCRERPAEFSQLVEKSIEMSQGIFKHSGKALSLGMIAGTYPYNSLLWRQITFSQWLELFGLFK